MSRCTRCTTVPAPIIEAGTLCVAPPLAHSIQHFRKLLHGLDLAFSEPIPNLLAIPLAPGVLGRIANGVRDVLSRAELHDTRSLIVADASNLSLADFVAMQPLSTLVSRVQEEWFVELLRNRRFTSHFQPILRADETDRPYAYECLLRGHGADGSLIPPDRLFQVARNADLMFHLDHAARLTAIDSAAAHHLDAGDAKVFINFNPVSIYDPEYCLRTTIAAISQTQLSPDRIVFEVVESEHIEDVGHLVLITDYYRKAGFKIALDDLGSGYGSLNLLGELRPDFVKLDMQLIRDVDRDPYKANIVRKLLELSRDLGIETVAEGIETEGEWAWVRDHGADYVQGYLFGKPESTPAPAQRLTNAKLVAAGR